MKNIFTFITAVNDERVLRENLLKSPCIINSNANVILQYGFNSAGTCYNNALAKANTEYLIFCHQDMYFPEEWLNILLNNIISLKKDGSWGVIGCYGVDSGGNRFGYLYSNGLKKVLGKRDVPRRVLSLDEVVLITAKSKNIIFDEKLPGFHLYGTDLCLNAISKGHSIFAISDFCIHNSIGYKKLPKEFWHSYKYIAKKWREYTPLETSVAIIEKNRIMQEIYIFENHIRSLFKKGYGVNGDRHENPKHLLTELTL